MGPWDGRGLRWGSLTASTLLAIGLALYVGQGDEVERLLRATGKVRAKVHWDISPPSSEMSVDLPPGGIESNPIFAKLTKRGWSMSSRVKLPDGEVEFLHDSGTIGHRGVVFTQVPSRLEVTYFRPAGPADKAVRAIKSFLHLGD